MNELIKKQAVKFGLIIAAISIFSMMMIYAIDIALMVSWISIVVSFLISMIITVIGVISVKKIQQGFISFKEAFVTYFLISLVSILIYNAFNILLFNVIDPDLKTEIKEITIQKTEQMLENFNTPEDAIEQALDKIRETDQFSMWKTIQNIFIALLFYAIIGLIVAAIVKRKHDPISE